MNDTEADALDRSTRDDIIQIINDVESDVLAEDKFGADRDMVAEGTCERIRERIHSRPTEPEGELSRDQSPTEGSR